MMKIILDTNFLIDCAKYHLDYCSELRGHKLYTLDGVVLELEKLIKQKKGIHAKLALQILKEKPVKVLKTKDKGSIGTLGSYVDDILVNMEGYAIATNDLNLKKRLKTKVFTIRQKKYIKEIK